MSSEHVSRRALTRGVAWTMPVVAVGVAAPAFAASGSALSATITGCRCPGTQKRYRLNVTFVNTTTSYFLISSVSVAVAGDTVTNLSPGFTLIGPGPGSTVRTFAFTRGKDSSPSTVTFAYNAINLSTGVSTPASVTASVTWSTCDDDLCD